MRQLRIEHITEYDFSAEVELLPHRLMLRPRESHSVRIATSTLTISPTAHVRWLYDVHDNSVAIASFATRARQLRIASEVSVEHYEHTPLDFLLEDRAARYPLQYGASEEIDLQPHRALLWPGQRSVLADWLSRAALPTQGCETFVLLDRLNRLVHESFRYQSRDAQGVQSVAQTLSLRSGSCRDLAALFMEACRHLGIAARFVSGYRATARPDGRGTTHAWAEVYLPGPGWKGFDPSEGALTGDEHIAVAVARHPELVPPVAGSYRGPSSPLPTMRVQVRVSGQ